MTATQIAAEIVAIKADDDVTAVGASIVFPLRFGPPEIRRWFAGTPMAWQTRRTCLGAGFVAMLYMTATGWSADFYPESDVSRSEFV